MVFYHQDFSYKKPPRLRALLLILCEKPISYSSLLLKNGNHPKFPRLYLEIASDVLYLSQIIYLLDSKYLDGSIWANENVKLMFSFSFEIIEKLIAYVSFKHRRDWLQDCNWTEMQRWGSFGCGKTNCLKNAWERYRQKDICSGLACWCGKSSLKTQQGVFSM